MKKGAAFVIISLVSIMLTTSCTTKSTVTPTGMTATGGDNTFSISGGLITANKSTGTLYINASDTINHRSITLTIYNYTAQTGNVTINGVNAQATYDSTSSPSNIENAYYGNINLTAVSPQLIGTFNFTCTDSTKVKNGTFSVAAPL